MPFTGPPEDRAAIRELYETNADGACRNDRATWLGCFAGDARWTTHYFDLTGIDAISAKYDEIVSGVVDTTFFLQIGSIEVSGDTARCRVQQDESLLYGNGSSYDLVGLYEDDLIRRDGRWQFLNRTYRVKRERAPVPA